MTYGEVKKRALQLLDQYSNGGALISESDPNSKDYILKFPQLCDEAQMEIATTVQMIPAVAHMKIGYETNLLGTLPETEVQLDSSVAPLYIAGPVKGAQSIYFEYIGGDFNAEVEQETSVGSGIWNNCASIGGLASDFNYARVKLSFNADTVNNVRIKFWYFSTLMLKNLAMYPLPYTVSTVPVYGDEIEVILPSTFYRMDRLLQDGNPVEYTQVSKTTISIPRTNTGELDAYYFVYPLSIQDIDPSMLDNFPLVVSEEACRAIPHYIAAKCMEVSPQLARQSALELAEYQAKLANLTMPNRFGGGGTVTNSFFSAGAKSALQSTMRS